MVLPIIRSNGDVIYPKSAVLPKKTVQKEEYHGSIKVLERFNNKSEVNQSDWQDELAPDRPFIETLNAINQDPRLNLSNETYVQMVLGKGLRVTAKKEAVVDLINEWFDDIGFHESLEDGLYSYLGTGNWIVEKNPIGTEFIEIPIHSVSSIVRTKNGDVKYYVQHINNKDIFLKPEEVVHFKLSNVAREPFGRGLFHSILTDYTDPRTGDVYDSPLIQMKQVEDNLIEIIKGHADPTVMFHFADAGEQFIKTQADALKNMKKGSKIVTDKEFDVKIVESSGNSKFEGWLEHFQRDLIEPGSKFPLQFFNAGFTARAASESTDSVLIRKVRRIQERLAGQIKRFIILPYLRKNGKSVKSKDIQVFFETPQKQAETIQEVITAFRDNIIRRSEARQWLINNTNVAVNQEDMADEPPITSVTPTNQMKDTSNNTQESYKDDLKMMLNIRDELDRVDKKKKTEEIFDFIRGLT